MIRHKFSIAVSLLCGVFLLVSAPANAADEYDAAVKHAGRPPADSARDVLDQPTEMLRLAGIKPGMKVADVLAGDGYYSELLSYIVGPSGRVWLINNLAFDNWSQPALKSRLAGDRLANVTRETVDLNDMKLPAASLDAVLLVKVYHDLYWVDANPKSPWPKIDVSAVLEQLSRALKPGGVLLLIDHSAKAGHGKADAGELHRIEEAFAVKDFTSHGFTVVAKSDLLRRPDDARELISYKGPALGKTDRFVLVFRKT
ncbi:MAG: methyltransferase domain-containing protein [Pseudomonadota bacterium]|nr:methyltransferase domain-containing protein [Pseudomonadota bacterium]